MNNTYLSLLTDDILDIIYKHLYQLNMKSIINNDEINKELDRRWKHLTNKKKHLYINTHYKTKYAIFCIYDKKSLMRIDKIAFKGYCRIIQNIINIDNIDLDNIDIDNMDNIDYYVYKSNILYNPTYYEILLEVDKYIEISGDYNHHYLESVNIDSIEKDEIYGEILLLDMFLGS